MLVVTWMTELNGGVNGFEVSYSPVGSFCNGVVGGRKVVEGGGTMTYVLSDLQAYTEYSVSVRARGADGFGQPSAAMMERTQAGSKLKGN